MRRTASIAAASGLKPVRFIIGIVSQPSTITLATAEPEIVPNMLEEMTGTLPGPPRCPPCQGLGQARIRRIGGLPRVCSGSEAA